MGKKKSNYYQYMHFSAIGIELAASIAVGAFIGYWMDIWLDTSPWFLIFWVLCGIFAGFRSLIRVTKKYLKDNKNDSDQ